ncbi:MAG: hypothetical protein ACLVJ6_03230 [Merdibacter sp.]
MKTSRFMVWFSHAGGSPDKGINALYAATGAAGGQRLRETFRDDEHIRFHPITEVDRRSTRSRGR